MTSLKDNDSIPYQSPVDAEPNVHQSESEIKKYWKIFTGGQEIPHRPQSKGPAKVRGSWREASNGTAMTEEWTWSYQHWESHHRCWNLGPSSVILRFRHEQESPFLQANVFYEKHGQNHRLDGPSRVGLQFQLGILNASLRWSIQGQHFNDSFEFLDALNVYLSQHPGARESIESSRHGTINRLKQRVIAYRMRDIYDSDHPFWDDLQPVQSTFRSILSWARQTHETYAEWLP